MTGARITFKLTAGIENAEDATIDLRRIRDIIENAFSLTGDEISWTTCVNFSMEMMDE